MLYQEIPIGDGRVMATVGYTIEDDTYCIVCSITVRGVDYDIGVFEEPQLEFIADQLAAGHDGAIRSARSDYLADCAADRDAFRSAYEE